MKRLSNKDLLNSLLPYSQNTPLLDLISNSLGYISFMELSKDSTDRLQSFLLDASDELFTLWLLEKNRVVLFQSTRAAQTLTVSIPLSRVRRVVSEIDSSSYKITIEIDADRVIASTSWSSVDGLTDAVSSVVHASYSLSGNLSGYPNVLPFLTSINQLLK
jgi:hypothetical protein